MSAELLLGLVIGVVGIAAAVAVPVWQIRHGEQTKRTLPPQNHINVYALTALRAAEKKGKPWLTSEQLCKEIVKTHNVISGDGNFKLGGKNKKLRALIDGSVKTLLEPVSEKLGALIEDRGGKHSLTDVGRDICVRMLKVEGLEDRSLKLHDFISVDPSLDRESKSSGAADESSGRSAADSAPRRPRTASEWRFAVFMAMPPEGSHTRDELEKTIGKKLRLSPMRQQAFKNLKDALAWNLSKGNLREDGEGRIALHATQDGKRAGTSSSAAARRESDGRGADRSSAAQQAADPAHRPSAFTSQLCAGCAPCTASGSCFPLCGLPRTTARCGPPPCP